MKKTILTAAVIVAGLLPMAAFAQKGLPKQITVKGKVKFDVPPGQSRKV